MKKAQQAVEYATLFGIIALIIATSIILFTQYASSTQDDIVLETTEGTLNILMKEAERVYFIGKGSKNILRVNIPRHILEIQSCRTSNCPRSISALIQLSKDSTEVTVSGSAPINASINAGVPGTKTLLIHYTNQSEDDKNYAVVISEILEN